MTASSRAHVSGMRMTANRTLILRRLADGPATTMELVAVLRSNQADTYNALLIMRDYGVVKGKRVGRNTYWEAL